MDKDRIEKIATQIFGQLCIENTIARIHDPADGLNTSELAILAVDAAEILAEEIDERYNKEISNKSSDK
jgi:hypothetical protein